jgi:hypothetical protein
MADRGTLILACTEEVGLAIAGTEYVTLLRLTHLL